MKKQGEKLSYARLVSRTDFYKSKALDLEQQIVFAEENAKNAQRELARNGEELAALRSRKAELEESHEQMQKDRERLQKEYEALKEKAEGQRSEEKIEALSAKLEEKDQTISKMNETIVELNQKKNGEERIREFERLLGDVQKDLNSKEEQIDSYKARVKSLEKRLANEQAIPVRKVFSEKREHRATEGKVLPYFDYSIVINEEKESIIRGNFHIENIGDRPLGTPFVCFRFYPLDASTLKGKIISIEKAEQAGASEQTRWVYMDSDWGKTAKERGEIWVRPYGELQLKPEGKLTLPDFQIPVKKHFDDKVIVEGFVYFQRSQYKEKAVNQILITF